MRFDLHIHSCLSPCALLEMSPRAIVQRACEAGLDAIALCDHNSARNTPALREACAAEGIACLFGMEIATAEELHALAIFDTDEAALDMTGQIYAALPPRLNVPKLFGEQPVVDADDQILDLDWHLLSAPALLPVREVAAAVHSRHAERAIWRRRFPGLPVLCASDAHQLQDIGTAWNEAPLPDFSVASLHAALAADEVHCVVL